MFHNSRNIQIRLEKNNNFQLRTLIWGPDLMCADPNNVNIAASAFSCHIYGQSTYAMLYNTRIAKHDNAWCKDLNLIDKRLDCWFIWYFSEWPSGEQQDIIVNLLFNHLDNEAWIYYIPVIRLTVKNIFLCRSHQIAEFNCSEALTVNLNITKAFTGS